jgi:hypothetical protein
MATFVIRPSQCRRALAFAASMFFFSLQPARADFLDMGPEEVASHIDSCIHVVDSALEKCDIRAANKNISFIEYKIQKYNEIILKDNKKAYAAKITSLKAAIGRLVDSLVQANLTVLHTKGRTEAIAFRQQAAARGLSETQLVPVDNAIVDATSSSENASAPVQDASSSPSAVVEDPQQRKSGPPGSSLDDILTAEIKFPESKPEPPSVPAPEQPAASSPKSKPEKRQPPPSYTPPPEPESKPSEIWPESASSSAPPVQDAGPKQGKKQADSVSTKIAGLRDENKFDEAMTLIQIHRSLLQKFLSNRSYEKLKSSVESASTQDQNKREQATKLVREIENLVEQDQSMEAHNRFNAKHDFLRQYCDPMQFEKLEKKVGDASVSFGQEQAKATIRAREIRTTLAVNKVEAAAAFDRSKDDLKQYLHKEAFEELRKTVADSVASVRDKAKQSQLIKRQIQVLIDKRKGDSALTCFMKNKPILKDFLDTGSFSKLAVAALKASNDWLWIQAKAKADLRQIDSLMAAKRFEQARDRFNASKDTIRPGMNDDKRFFELKGRVMTAYDDLLTKKKKTERSVGKINSLIDQKEGREAQKAFGQDTALLKEYLERTSYSKLEGAVRKSCAEYDANVAAARKTAGDIDGYLEKRRIELAYTTFKKSRGNFNRYMENDTTIEALGKRVDKAFLEFRKHKKWAEDMIHEVHWFIDHEKGDEAMTHLKKVRPELSLYIETGVLSSLDSAATRAHNDFLAAKTLAEKNTLRLRTLLKKKRCEEAFTLFQELKPGLEQYLADTAFAGISNEVNSANDELKDKKKRAEDFAKNLKGLVDDNKQKDARKEFTANRQTLKQYLDPKVFVDLEKLVMSSPKKGAKLSRD